MGHVSAQYRQPHDIRVTNSATTPLNSAASPRGNACVPPATHVTSPCGNRCSIRSIDARDVIGSLSPVMMRAGHVTCGSSGSSWCRECR